MASGDHGAANLRRFNNKKALKTALKTALKIKKGTLNMNFKTLITAIAFSLAATTAVALEVGDQAPDFLLEATDGESYSVSQFKGKEAVVIAWYPKAFGPGLHSGRSPHPPVMKYNWHQHYVRY